MLFTTEIVERMQKDVIMFASPSVKDKGKSWLPVGRDVPIGASVRIEAHSGLYAGPYRPMRGGTKYSGLCTIGALSYSSSPLPEGLVVGRYCSISEGVRFIDSHHPLDLVTTSVITFRPKNPLCKDFTNHKQTKRYEWEPHNGKPFPKIGHDVWIGDSVTLAMGITIGTGAVIAAGSVVTKSVEPYQIVGGNPARPIRKRFDEHTVQALLESQWWLYDPTVLAEIGFDNPLGFIEKLGTLKADGAIGEFKPVWYEITNEAVVRHAPDGVRTLAQAPQPSHPA